MIIYLPSGETRDTAVLKFPTGIPRHLLLARLCAASAVFLDGGFRMSVRDSAKDKKPE